MHVALRHIGDLRTIYTFYSRLGATSPDNVYTLRRLQVRSLMMQYYRSN